MTINELNNGFEIIFDYRPHIVADVKSIPSIRWNPKNKSWFAPIQSINHVQLFAKKYGINNEKDTSPEVIGDIAPMPELTIEIPLKQELFPYQKQGVAKGLELEKYIIGDEPGLGKTAQSIATVIGANIFPCLVICPSSLKENWKREWENKWTNKRCLILSDKVKNTWPQYWETGLTQVFIVNYESLKKYFVKDIKRAEGEHVKLRNIQFKESINVFKSIIIDESHRCKDGSTLQSKLVMGISKSKDYVIALTGTPVQNKPKDLISQLYIINQLDKFGGYKHFINRYCDGGNGASNLQELNYLLNKHCFFRREKKEVLQELPDKMRQVIFCDINTRKEYNTALNDLKQYLKDNGCSDRQIAKKLRGEIMVKIGILKNISAKGKMDEVVEHITEVIESGEKIVVFCHLKEVASELLKHFPKAVTVRGDDSMESRQRSVDAFQNNSSVQCIICSIKAAGVGLTLTASSRVAFIELPWHPADVDQCEDRTHRIGQKESVQITYFLGKDTIDEWNYKLIEKKREISNVIVGASTDIETEIIDSVLNLFNQEN